MTRTPRPSRKMRATHSLFLVELETRLAKKAARKAAGKAEAKKTKKGDKK